MKRITWQRKAILEELRKNKRHPSAEDLYLFLKKKFPRIGIATIYRNLRMMTKEGLVKEIKLQGGLLRYDGDIQNHMHFLCKKCEKIYDLPLKYTKHLIKDSSLKKFFIESVDINLTGLCWDCLKKYEERSEPKLAWRQY